MGELEWKRHAGTQYGPFDAIWDGKKRVAVLDERDEKTAKIFAAAPELLTVLKTLVAQWDSISPSKAVPDEINDDDTWDAARTAIAKAEGA